MTLALPQHALLGLCCVYGCAAAERPGHVTMEDDSGAPTSTPRVEDDASTMQLLDAGVPGGHDAKAAAMTDAAPVSSEPRCGDDIINREQEACDRRDFGGLTCVGLGFDDGLLRCREDCSVDLSDCSGEEQCFDGRDNDGDGLVDCQDEECEAACLGSCDEVPDLRQLATLEGSALVVRGTTRGRASELESSCALQPGASETAYRIVPAQDGVLSVRLSSTRLLSVSVLSECGLAELATDASAPEGELGCAPTDRNLVVPTTEGQELFIVVDGRRPDDEGEYSLEVVDRAIACGDGHRDEAEPCDDGNTQGGDGCSANCEVESSEVEPNNELADASAYANPFYGRISPADDVDFMELTLPENTSYALFSTLSLGDGACAAGLMDPYLQVFDSAGELLAEDDDSGDGFCASLALRELAAGTYFVAVSAVAESSPASFPYRLAVVTSVCGDGVRGIGEACDDGNTSDGDDCTADCQRP